MTRLKAGQYTFVVTDSSKTQNFRARRAGREQEHEPRPAPAGATWTLTLKKGDVHVQLERASCAQEDLQGHVALPTP